MKNRLPLLFLLSGGVAVAVGLSFDLIWIESQAGFGPNQSRLVWMGLTLLLTGFILDIVFGSRHAIGWFHQQVTDGLSIWKFIGVSVQLGLLVLVIGQYHLESEAFYHNIMLLTFFGFLIHHFLPKRYRLPFFLLLSLAGISGLFGFPDGLWLISIGLSLIGICHLPIPYGVRVLILIAAGSLLMILRVGWIEPFGSWVLWPIIASLFMFRLIVYMYDLRHRDEPVSVAKTLSYFFLLPNLVFPFFPVVDFNTFDRTYYNEDRYRIYQRGVEWIFRGVIHLILYRFIYLYMVIPPEEVVTAGDLIHFLSTNFLLYLRISGMFHLVIGLLHLFGFNLPETNHLYCFSSSFTDFWRRINIYWKDFMQKIFFYPLYFRLRRWKPTAGLVLSTFFVFFVTWLLHAYQWFWIRGSFLLSMTDTLFWLILAVLVVGNVLFESKYGRKRSLKRPAWTFTGVALRSVKVVGVFSVVCILWSLWTSTDLNEWFSLWSSIEISSEDISGLLPLFFGIALVLGGVSRLGATGGGAGNESINSNKRRWSFLKPAVLTSTMLIVLYTVGTPMITSHFSWSVVKIIRDLQQDKLSKRDSTLMVRGYYEELTNVNRFNSRLWEVYSKKPPEWNNLYQANAVIYTHDFMRFELKPFLDLIFKGARLRTNRWGMRDRDYERDPPPDVYRIVLTGDSHTMGTAVADHETFDWHLEERLNQETREKVHASYEVLNFGVGGYDPPQQIPVLETKGFLFQPDCAIYVAHEDEGRRSTRFVQQILKEEVEIPYAFLKEILNRSAIHPDMTRDEIVKRLNNYQDEIVEGIYRRYVESCRKQGVLPVWVFLPAQVGERDSEITAQLLQQAESAGFVTFDLSDVYQDHDPVAIRVSEWDLHPNVKGHQLIAERLYENLSGSLEPFSTDFSVSVDESRE